MCWSSASATSITPMRMRKESASIFTVGWASTNFPMGPAKTSITPTASTMATTITSTCCAMPTAVITESSEKTMSRSAIWRMVQPKVAFRLSALVHLVAGLELVVDLEGGLADEEEAAHAQDEIAPGEPLARPPRRGRR